MNILCSNRQKEMKDFDRKGTLFDSPLENAFAAIAAVFLVQLTIVLGAIVVWSIKEAF